MTEWDIPAPPADVGSVADDVRDSKDKSKVCRVCEEPASEAGYARVRNAGVVAGYARDSEGEADEPCAGDAHSGSASRSMTVLQLLLVWTMSRRAAGLALVVMPGSVRT